MDVFAVGAGHRGWRRGVGQGFRGKLLEIAHEEMIHFLVVNNVLRALGEPFYAPTPDFERARRFGSNIEVGLEAFSLRTLERLIRLEIPHDHASPVLEGYRSIAELYRAIGEALVAHPEYFVTRRFEGGGEHHLFLNESYDKHHPDFQLEAHTPKTLHCLKSCSALLSLAHRSCSLTTG